VYGRPTTVSYDLDTYRAAFLDHWSRVQELAASECRWCQGVASLLLSLTEWTNEQLAAEDFLRRVQDA